MREFRGFIRLLWRVGRLYSCELGSCKLGYDVPWWEIEKRGWWFENAWEIGVRFNGFMGKNGRKKLVDVSISIKYYGNNVYLQCADKIWVVDLNDEIARWRWYLRPDQAPDTANIVREDLARQMLEYLALATVDWMKKRNEQLLRDREIIL